MKTTDIKCIEIKLIIPESTDGKTILNTGAEIESALNKVWNSDSCRTLYISKFIDESVIESICKKYEIEMRKGVSGGCYGARTGRSHKGYTLWCPLDLMGEYLNTEYNEFAVNPLFEIDNYGGELLDLTDEQIENFFEVAYQADIDLKYDNSYNYGHSLEGCYFIADFDLKTHETDNFCILFAKFHCGGDIRGNYTNWFAFRFDSIDDLHGAILPYREVTEEETENNNEAV